MSTTTSDIRTELKITPQVEATMRAMLSANPAWQHAMESEGQFANGLYLIVRSITGVLNDLAGARPIEDLDLSVRGYNVLKREGVHTVAQLVEKTVDDLYDMRNMGWKSVDEIIARLSLLDLKLKPSPAGELRGMEGV